MKRFNVMVVMGTAVMVLAGCGKDSGTFKTDSAAADSIRDAQAAEAMDTAAAPADMGSPTDSAQGTINSTEGTIGETRKKVPGRMAVPDTMSRDSVVRGPYQTMDSLGRIKR
ncbi:MAG TPA: hypothetical protein VM053_06155 [Gemmatimonadaceae bacterium]|nr:hypothetical protein [Gemmatimonadaceae bacterium]